MYFKRPSFRRGGGIDQLTPRVRANEGFFGSTPIYPIPLNQIKASAAMPMGSGTVPMMKSFPQDATEMGVASIRSVDDSPVASSSGTIAKKKRSDSNLALIEAASPDQEFITIFVGPANSPKRIKNPKYVPKGEFRDIKGGKGKVFITDKKENKDSGASAFGKGTKFKKSEDIIDIEAGPKGDQITMATDKEKEARAAALTKSLEDKKREVIPGDDDDSITLDPLEEIKKEKDFLSDLLRNEGLERGEIALIAAKALGTEGSLKEKLDAAVNLALPVVRRRDKEEKALTLSAYKAFKEKEKATAKAAADAAKDTPTIKNLKYEAKILKESDNPKYKDKTENEILQIIVTERLQDPDETIRKDILKGSADTIKRGYEDVVEAKTVLDAYIKKQYTDKNKEISPKDNTLKGYQKELQKKVEEFKLFFDVKEFKDLYPTFAAGFARLGLQQGGRVKRSLGSPQTGEQIITTEAETIGAETAEKPVLKLTFAELRNRLPQEITDDVVQLLANSEEALQDFAYIETQNDVDSFNLKYGVNLIIPPAPQTA